MLKVLQRLYSNIITEITVVQRLSMSPSRPWQPNRCTLIYIACPWSFGCMTNRREISTGLIFTCRRLADSHRVHCSAQQQSSAETALSKWKTRRNRKCYNCNIKFLVPYPVSKDELSHPTDESYVSGFKPPACVHSLILFITTKSLWTQVKAGV